MSKILIPRTWELKRKAYSLIISMTIMKTFKHPSILDFLFFNPKWLKPKLLAAATERLNVFTS